MAVPTVRRAGAADAETLSGIAALTFPLACPPHTTAADIAHHIASRLNAAAFEVDLADPDTQMFLAESDGEPIGYLMLVGHFAPPVSAPGTSPMELRRIYVHPDWQGKGVADELVAVAVGTARERDHDLVWLGTNQMNERAIAFYRRHGFEVVGTKTFRVGEAVEEDYVMVRPVETATRSTQ